MLATLTNGRFSVPENPVMRGLSGFGLLQTGNASALGNSVDDPTQTATAAGQLIWTGGTSDDSPYTADYCNQIILGGTATDAEKYQCSIRGYVGAAAVYAIPPALTPAPPTSVTIPQAVQRVNSPRPAAPAVRTRCAGQQDDSSGSLMMIAGIALLAFLLAKD